jgi:hypothetical protein
LIIFKWRLLEASLVSVPADSEAMIRSYSGRAIGARAAALARMRLRQRTVEKLDD